MKTSFFVLTPVYKVEKYIRQCIESVLNQTYTNYMLILVDDGSPDASGMICDAYSKKDPRVHVIHKDNQGLISARRAAISYVKNTYSADNAYFVFLDSDDYLETNALEVLADTIKREQCDVVVYGMQRVFNGKVLGPHDPNPFVGAIYNKRDLYRRMFGSAKYNPLCRKAIRCDLMEDLDYTEYYHISNGEDLLQDIPVYKACQKVVYIPDVLYNYTSNPDSMTQALTYDRFKISSTVRAQVWEFLEQEDLFTREDWEAYLECERKRLSGMVYTIGQFRVKYAVKMQEFEKVRSDSYFAMLLEKSKIKQRHLRWLKKGAYWRLDCWCKLKCNAMKILHKTKRMRE